MKDRVTDVKEFGDAVRRVGEGGSAIDPEVVSRLLGRQRDHDPVGDLTQREREVLELMAEGLSNQGICERLYLSPKTIEAHVHGIFMKLGLRPTPGGHRRVSAVLALLRS
ncbi:MAG TPA: response regulator transcription factor [Thermoleophilaceae bacterium]